MGLVGKVTIVRKMFPDSFGNSPEVLAKTTQGS